MTEAEIIARFTGYKSSFSADLANSTIPKTTPHQFNSRRKRQLERAIDWRDYGAVTSIKDQGNCESCYAFAAAATLESSHFIWHKQIWNLSTQELIDCSRGNVKNGCDGGLFNETFNYMEDNGLTDWDSYKYEARDKQPCRRAGKNQAARVARWRLVEPNENALMNSVYVHGPTAVGICVNDDFLRYSTGILKTSCDGELNHAAVVIGYGTNEKGIDYWIVKNQWGEGWGERGYIKMLRNANNMCGIASYAVRVSAE